MAQSIFEKKELIGQGSFGRAWKVTSKGRRGVFIMKEVSGLNPREIESAKNEIKILREVQHENVVKYVDDFTEPGKFLIVMEYCEGGDLGTYIKQQRQPLPEDQIMNWFKKMSAGIDYVHDRKIIHRDLKPENVFLTSWFQLKIGDFGVSKSLTQTMDMASTLCGTPVYMAPELLEKKPYDKKADIWGLGCILFELAARKQAFSSLMEIIKGQYDMETLKKLYSSDLLRHVSLLLNPDPSKRPSAGDIFNLKHAAENTKEELPTMIVISSTGGAGAAQHAGRVLGQYNIYRPSTPPHWPHMIRREEEERRNYVQSGTEQSNEKFQAFYLSPSEEGKWRVRTACGMEMLRSNNPSNNVPTGGWQYYDGKSWHEDATLAVTPGPLPALARQYKVEAKCPLFQGSVLFTKTEKWWLGRPVYDSGQGLFLYHGHTWGIGRRLGHNSALRGLWSSHIPASGRSWKFWNGSEWKQTTVVVTGYE